MNVQSRIDAAPPRREAMRIAGERLDTGNPLEVLNPWDGSVVGTVPRATPEIVARAFQIAWDHKPKLTRYERQRILLATAEKLVARKDEIARLITSCWISLVPSKIS